MNMSITVGGAVTALGLAMVAAPAHATFVPESGLVRFRVSEATNYYREINPTPGLDPVGRAPFGPGAGLPLVGDQRLSAFKIDAYGVDGPIDVLLPPGQSLVGVVTFLDVDSVATISFGGSTLGNVGFNASQARPFANGPAGTVGRIFFFLTDDPAAGDFDFAGTTTNAQVDFATGASDNLVSDGVASYAVDHLTGFTRGGGNYTLVLTGGLVPDSDGDVDDELTTSGTTGHPEQAYSASIATHSLVADGGAWFRQGRIDNSVFNFQASETGYSGADVNHNGNAFDDFNLRGIESAYKGGWQIASDNLTAIRMTDPLILGDFDRDGERTNLDIQTMLDALVDTEGYKAEHGLNDARFLSIGDIDGDGSVGNTDIQAMLDMLTSSGGMSVQQIAMEVFGDAAYLNVYVPEPGTVVVMGLGVVGLLRRRQSRIRMTKFE
jgi:hypothetical protein